MWDSPGRMSRLADVLFAVAALLVLYALLRFAIHHPVFAVGELKVSGDTTRLSMEQVQDVTKREVRGTFFTTDIIKLRDGFETLPWVRRADVRRLWPDGLEVVIEEHKLLARWGKEQLVNMQGEVFSATHEGALPKFEGPEGSAGEVTAYYARLTHVFSSIGRKPVEVLLSPRRAWQVRLDDGMRLELGRNQADARLNRFVAAYPQAIAPLKRRIDYVDLRYANGFAVRVPGMAEVKDASAVRPGA